MLKNKRIGVVFVISLFFFSSCALLNSSREKEFKSDTYASAEYDFTINYPKSWTVVDKRNLKVGDFAVNILKKEVAEIKKLPLGVHADMQFSYVAIWPEGLGTELPRSQGVSLGDTTLPVDLNFPVNGQKSRLLLLKDGSIWGYFLKPEQPPASWSSFGFIFAQIRTNQPSIGCYDDQTGRELSMEKCGYPTQNKVIRSGSIDENEAKAINFILENINLVEVKKKDATDINSFIKVEQPSVNAVIHSPLTVTGKARGNWYFEGVFTVRLYDGSNELLDTGISRAKSKWMTDQLVPFEASLEFQAPKTERGRLVFQKANPTGLAKYDEQYIIPVRFSSD